MTTLEFLLIAILWVAYGVFSVYQISDNNFKDAEPEDWFILILFAPIVLVVRVVIGIFSHKTIK